MVFVNRTGPCNCLALSPGEWSLAARQKLQNNDNDGDDDEDDDDGDYVKKNHRRQTDQVSTQTLVTSGDFQNTTKHAQPAQTNKQTKFSAGIGSMNIWLSKKKPPKMLIFSFS